MPFTSRRLKAYSWLLLNTITWGATIPIVKWGLAGTTPFRFLLYRFAVGTLISLPVFFFYRKIIQRKMMLLLQVVGVEIIGTTVALSLLYIGLAQTTALEASLISTTGPVFVTLGGLLFLRERVSKREWFGLSLATGMTLLLILVPSFLDGGNVTFTNLWGNTLVMLQNFANVAYYLLAKRIYHHLPKLLTTCVSITVGFVSFFVLSLSQAAGSFQTLHLLVLQDLSHPSVWVIAFFAAIITSFVGLTTYLKGQDLIEASEASLFNYLQPIVYIPLSLLLLGEHIHLVQLFFFGLVMVGVYIAESRPHRTAAKVQHFSKRRRLVR